MTVGDDEPSDPLAPLEPGSPAADVACARRSSALIAIQAPPRLRLDELLRELGARDAGHVDVRDPDHISIGAIVDRSAEAGFGFLIGILTLIAIPFFGLSTPFGLAIATLGFQLKIGRQKPWESPSEIGHSRHKIM